MMQAGRLALGHQRRREMFRLNEQKADGRGGSYRIQATLPSCCYRLWRYGCYRLPCQAHSHPYVSTILFFLICLLMDADCGVLCAIVTTSWCKSNFSCYVITLHPSVLSAAAMSGEVGERDKMRKRSTKKWN